MSGAALLLGALIGCGAASGEPAESALLVVEKTSLGGEPEANRRWRVETDGDLFFVANRAPVEAGVVWNVPFPTEPLARLDAASLAALREQVQSPALWGLVDQSATGVEDGMRLRLTLRRGGDTKELTFDNVEPAPVKALMTQLGALTRR